MGRFSVRRVAEGGVAFAVVDEAGHAAAECASFLAELALHGRSPYTQRAYAYGLADFLGWLADSKLTLEAVDRRLIGVYLTAFRHGEVGGACRRDPSRAGQVNPLTRKAAPGTVRRPRTVNHRLSVLASFFAHLIGRDSERGEGPWRDRENPVPLAGGAGEARHGMAGRDAPRRGRRGELRQRVPKELPHEVEPALAPRLVEAAGSWRDKAILTLLWRTGQRIGDWSELGGRHGLLGLRVCDLDAQRSSIVVLLKGSRDEHRVPVGDDFWPHWRRYLATERGPVAPGDPAWIAFRRGGGRPLGYPAFESALRLAGHRLGANVNAHMFRHALARALIEACGLKVAQEVLGHRHLATTADSYARVDEAAMADALAQARALLDRAGAPGAAGGYAFAYDDATLAELEALARPEPGTRR